MGERQQPQFLFDIGHAGQGDADGRRPAFTDGMQQLRAIHAGHADVADDHIMRGQFKLGEGVGTAIHKCHVPLVSQWLQSPAQSLQDLWLIIDEQHMAPRRLRIGTHFHVARISAEMPCRAPG